MFKKLVLLFVMIVVSSQTVAETGSWTTVKQVYVDVNGSIYVYFNGASMPDCYQDSSGYLKNVSEDSFNRLYSTLLSALHAKTTVQPFYDIVGADQGQWSRCQVTALYIREN